jgi:hypothetical protein
MASAAFDSEIHARAHSSLYWPRRLAERKSIFSIYLSRFLFGVLAHVV